MALRSCIRLTSSAIRELCMMVKRIAEPKWEVAPRHRQALVRAVHLARRQSKNCSTNVIAPRSAARAPSSYTWRWRAPAAALYRPLHVGPTKPYLSAHKNNRKKKKKKTTTNSPNKQQPPQDPKPTPKHQNKKNTTPKIKKNKKLILIKIYIILLFCAPVDLAVNRAAASPSTDTYVSSRDLPPTHHVRRTVFFSDVVQDEQHARAP